VQGQKKDMERRFLERFLALTRQTVKVIDTERPDFVLVSDGSRTGVEVTRVPRHGDVDASMAQRDEAGRRRALAALARLYYRAGGLPLALKVSNARSLEGSQANALVARLVAARAGMNTNEQLLLDPDENGERDRFHLRALPESFNEYSRWEYLDDPGEHVHTLDSALLEKIVVRKAKHLPHYRRGLREVQLLIVAERLHKSGRWQPPQDFATLPKHGFDAVHLLMHPIEVRSVV
jgi:hypothetical protein